MPSIAATQPNATTPTHRHGHVNTCAELPAQLGLSAEEWLFCSPTQAAALFPAIQSASAIPSLSAPHIHALATITLALLRGARTCQRHLAARHGDAFAEVSQRGDKAGWLASPAVRGAAVAVLNRCIDTSRPLPRRWVPGLTELVELLLARCAVNESA
jgi:hypothetical protein